MSQAVSHWSFMAEAWIQSRAVLVEFVVGRVALGQLFLRLLPVFCCQYHSTNAPFSVIKSVNDAVQSQQYRVVK
jgi:hypothetical protein